MRPRVGEVEDCGAKGIPRVPKHRWDGYCLLTEDAKGLERIMEEESIDGRYFRKMFEAGWMCFQELEPSLNKLNVAISRLKK